MKIISQKAGFNLIELIVVISIIALISTFALNALNTARQKSRDTKRVADLKQIQKALEIYYNQASVQAYPNYISLGLGDSSKINDCSSAECTKITSSGIVNNAGQGKVYMGLIPADPGAEDGLECAGTDTKPCHYSYSRITPINFIIKFYLERGVEGINKGPQCLTESGFTNEPCP